MQTIKNCGRCRSFLWLLCITVCWTGSKCPAFSAAVISSSRNAGCATEISFSARSQVLQPHQIHTAVLGDDVVGQAARICDHITGDQRGIDAGNHLPCLLVKDDVRQINALPPRGNCRRLQKVQLASGSADLSNAGALGTDLSIQVHGDTVVDRHKIVQLAHHRRIIAVRNRVVTTPGFSRIQSYRSWEPRAKTENALIPVQSFLIIGNLSGLVHIQIGVAQHLRMDN